MMWNNVGNTDFITLRTKINGKLLPEGPLPTDPFDIRSFPKAVDHSRGKTLEDLGKDIRFTALELAKRDPTIENVDVKYVIEGGQLKVTINQEHTAGYNYMRQQHALKGITFREEPKNHLLRASLAVLNGRGQGGEETIQGLSMNILQQWRTSRKVTSFHSRAASAALSFATMAGFMSSGAAYYGGVPL